MVYDPPLLVVNVTWQKPELVVGTYVSDAVYDVPVIVSVSVPD
jgi:hypothetical protein